ncbi:phosphoribosylanthranilate isomerase [Paenibacillus sp. UNCCL117]|uniref:phosphoribosylanthranilate isomerase n=1 Tax=unclassified Paenibacillus TaxID=185978 RepID=UPI0008829805|nr:MULTISPECIES: phosphoribosylanthranilate isomerase [unclassified Paenibacillus]SDC40788.1 Phosphoribosylanthranilate isomerase [Paenibacillus sp. cl123]SFW13701.1 phosphoribosylanthranilate isomerase [Paenibacillus sp. UNCCL117]
MALVKICGLLTPEQAAQTARLPVDYIGLVFARSKRQVSPAQAAELIAAIRQESGGRRIKVTGVFVNPELEQLDAVMREAALDVLQLHGQEPPEFCRAAKARYAGVEVLKAVSLSAGSASGSSPAGAAGENQAEPTITAAVEGSRAQALLADSGPQTEADQAVYARLNPYLGAIDGVLLDTLDPVYGGGSGHAFDWSAIPPYLAWCRQAGLPLLVAGGLQPGNVGALLERFAPSGVDVSSGVETDGVKDISKITRFVERVKSIV